MYIPFIIACFIFAFMLIFAVFIYLYSRKMKHQVNAHEIQLRQLRENFENDVPFDFTAYELRSKSHLRKLDLEKDAPGYWEKYYSNGK
jgi:hypothetical protein